VTKKIKKQDKNQKKRDIFPKKLYLGIKNPTFAQLISMS